jgi:SNF2 family DNA or RNA helicase
MVKFFRNVDSPHKVNVSWSCRDRKNFYDILNIVKSFVGAYRKDRIWRISIDDARTCIDNLVEDTSETIHVDMEIFSSLFKNFKKKKSLKTLRNKLEGVDSGIELQGDFNLLPFQHVGVKFASIVKNLIIADKVGLGKTISGFCSAWKLKQDGVIEKALVVVPSSIKVKWARDIMKFLGEESHTLEGTPAQRTDVWRKWQNDDSTYCITSYDTIKRDVLQKVERGYDFNEESYLAQYTKKNYAIILDEIQRVRNPVTARSKCCRVLSTYKKCTARIGLSATYIETGLEDLFGVMLVIDDSIFGNNVYAFDSQFIQRDYMGKINSYKNVDEAAERMQYVSVRRNKEMVKDQLNAMLPKVNENTLWLELTKKQKALTNQIITKTVDVLKNMEKTDKINMTTALTEIGYLRQVALSAEMIDPDVKESAKVDALIEMLPEIVEENKVVIFCFYTQFIDIMERDLKKAGINCYAMHGKRDEGQEKNRQKIVDEFSASKDTHVLIASDVLKEGIDIPAASYVINTDILWNPAGMIQRCGRIDRLNQQAENIYNVNLWGQGSIEEQMFEKVYERLEIANKVIDGGATEKRHRKVNFSDLKQMLRNMGGKI